MFIFKEQNNSYETQIHIFKKVNFLKQNIPFTLYTYTFHIFLHTLFYNDNESVHKNNLNYHTS